MRHSRVYISLTNQALSLRKEETRRVMTMTMTGFYFTYLITDL